MTSVFVSYRRSDAAASAGRIADGLQAHFGSEHIFFDVETVPLGTDFRDVVSDRLDKSDVFLAVIGDHWLDVKDEQGRRRIDNVADNVYIEVANALTRKDLKVIPVLVGDASMPREDELPDGLKELAYRNAIILRSDTTFAGQMDRLITDIEGVLGPPKREAPVGASKRNPWKWAVGLLVPVVILFLLMVSLAPDVSIEEGGTETAESLMVTDAFVEYEHGSGAFSITIPSNWDIEETVNAVSFFDGDSVIAVSFADPGAISITDVLDGLIAEEWISSYDGIQEVTDTGDDVVVLFEYASELLIDGTGELTLTQWDQATYGLTLLTPDYEEVETVWYTALDSFEPTPDQ